MTAIHLILMVLLIPSGAKAAPFYGLVATSNQEVPFFKNPESLFPSGTATRDRLISYMTPMTQKHKKSIKYFIGSTELNPNQIEIVTSDSLSSPGLSKAESLRDFGGFQTTTPTHLYSEPDFRSVKLAKIPQNVHLKKSRQKQFLKNGFLLTRFNGAEGYVNFSHLISKFDFAVWVSPKKNKEQKWRPVKARLFDQLEMDNQELISIADIDAIWTDQQKGFIFDDSSQTPKWPKWTKVSVVGGEDVVFKSSRLPGHQLIWWSEPEITLAQNNKTLNTLTINELLKRKIASVSFHPKNPRKALVSADGIFKTENGETWTRLTQFENYSGPVHYYNDLLQFIGPYRTVNGGRDYENFIKVDQLSSAISQLTGLSPKNLELQNIKTTSTLKLILDVRVGGKKFTALSQLYSQNWTVRSGW